MFTLEDLIEKKCFLPEHHKKDRIIVLLLNQDHNTIEMFRNVPPNKEAMRKRNERYVSNHPKYKCRRGYRCVFPHSQKEASIWNILVYGDQWPEDILGQQVPISSVTLSKVHHR